MKRVFFIAWFLLALATACNEGGLPVPDDDLATKAEISQYVDELMLSLREGTLSSTYCPDVQWAHIPALLEYGKSTKVVGDGPVPGARAIPSNPISSFLMFECSEGMFALWMVEAARIHTLHPSATGIGGWPSQNPIVQPTDGEPTWIMNDPAVQQEVLNAYLDWWKAAKGQKSAASKDPMEGTGYRWH